jgi:glyoxylase-like metal-dependent hydrolase (beta-lactamase superfamily II)
MKRYHLNCGTLYPPFGACLFGVGTPLRREPIVTHCILLESEDGLLLVDTGIGYADLETPDLFTWLMLLIGGSKRNFEQTAISQIRALGFKQDDVHHIALTHFHYDHASGLPDFPNAQVHIYKVELDALLQPTDLNERLVYRSRHWSHRPHWVPHQCQGDHWFGFDRTPYIDLGSLKFCFIPLPGHTRGHAGVALCSENEWLLHCGDAYTFHAEVDPINPREAPYSRTLRPIINLNYAFRNIGKHSKRLRELVARHSNEVTLTNSHDPVEFNKLIKPSDVSAS